MLKALPSSYNTGRIQPGTAEASKILVARAVVSLAWIRVPADHGLYGACDR